MRLPPTTTTKVLTTGRLASGLLGTGHWKIVWVAVRLEGNRETWTVVLVVVNGRESIAKPAPFSGHSVCLLLISRCLYHHVCDASFPFRSLVRVILDPRWECVTRRATANLASVSSALSPDSHGCNACRIPFALLKFYSLGAPIACWKNHSLVRLVGFLASRGRRHPCVLTSQSHTFLRELLICPSTTTCPAAPYVLPMHASFSL